MASTNNSVYVLFVIDFTVVIMTKGNHRDTEEGLSLLLGMDASTLRVVSEASDDDQVDDSSLLQDGHKRMISNSTPKVSVRMPVDLPQIDSNAFILSPTDGTISRPVASHIVQVVNLVDSDGNSKSATQRDLPVMYQGLIASIPIRKGQVIFTERAMEATQIPVSCSVCQNNPYMTGYRVRACQDCFRSLEPASSLSQIRDEEHTQNLPLKDLWPIAEYSLDGENNSYQAYSSKRIVEVQHSSRHSHSHLVNQIYRCQGCQALFCSLICAESHEKHLPSCCANTKAIQAIIHKYCGFSKDDYLPDSKSCTENTDESTMYINPSFVLATRMFCHATQMYRRLRDYSSWDDPFSTFCGEPSSLTANSLSPSTSSGADSIQSCYLALCSALEIDTTEENYPLTLNLFRRYVSVAQRNGFYIATQSPFSVYYQSLLRRAHNKKDTIEQLAYCLGSKNGKLDRNMDRQVDEKVRFVDQSASTFYERTNRFLVYSRDCCDIFIDRQNQSLL
jgi:hypothetical protein